MASVISGVTEVRDREIIEQGSWYSQLPQDLRSALLDAAKVRSYKPGEALFLRGDPCSGLFVLLEGRVRISGISEAGREAILTFIELGSWFGEIAVFDGNVRTHDAIADTDVCVAQIPQQDLNGILDETPEYWRDFGLLLANKLRLAFSALEDLSLLPAPVRLARRLLLMAQGYGERAGMQLQEVSVPQEQLGRMLSISRQTTNQILKDLAEQSLIAVRYGSIEITDPEGLREYCEKARSPGER